MKVKSVGILALLGMMLTSVSVWSVTRPETRIQALPPEVVTEPLEKPRFDGAEFTAGKTLMMNGRLGHARLVADKDAETFLLVNVTADSDRAAASQPLNLAIVIDRSGSMKGKRLRNALDAATGMVRRLRNGDVVSVITYSRETQVVVPSTTIDESSRERAALAINSVSAQGETCISCGIDTALQMLRQRAGMVDRMLLLTDGEATAGIKDLEGFRSLAVRVRDSGVAISSIGVDVDYNERTLAVLAQESNGRHHFVENSAALDRAFDEELDSLVRTVTKNSELSLDLGPGVELEQVLDRSFRRDGRRVIVPLGSFAAGEQKSLLARVRVARGAEGERPVADLRLSYDDASGQKADCVGKLAVLLTRDASELEPLDSVVAARINRSETAATLTEANKLFAAGQTGLARRRLDDKLDELKKDKRAAISAAPSARAKDLERDFERQERALGAASEGFATPPPADAPSGGRAPAPAKIAAERKGKAQVRANQKSAVDLAF